MAQQAKFIELTRTYLPIDPVSLTQNLTSSDAENSPEKRVPVMAYEGYNFMPTAYGYRSYFGTNSSVDLAPLPAGVLVDHMFVYQKQDYTNMIVALCGDGIYKNDGVSSQQPWDKVSDTEPHSTEAAYRPWSWCVIGTTVYMYMQGDDEIWVIMPDAVVDAVTEEQTWDAYEIHSFVPSFITMSGQMGIFKAGGRLGNWDSDNTVGWSAFEDLTDFTPAIKTQANQTKFVDVVGRITTVRQHGDGFIIYATKSIVYVEKDLSQTFLWKSPKVLSTSVGVAYSKQVAVANPDTIHFAWTSVGLLQIQEGKSEIIGTEVYDYLKESSEPILLSLVEGRYVFLEVMESDFLGAEVTVFPFEFPAITTQLTEYEAARHMLIDGRVVDGSNWTIPGYPGFAGMAGVDAIDEVAGTAGTPAVYGTDDVAAIPDREVVITWNTLRDASKLGQIASGYYRTSGAMWPEYQTGYIQMFSTTITNLLTLAEKAIFQYAATAVTYVTDATDLEDLGFGLERDIFKLYSGYGQTPFSLIPQLAFMDYATYGENSGDLQQFVYSNSPFSSPVPPEIGGNFVDGHVIECTPPEDVFGRALVAWMNERIWIRDFITGVRSRFASSPTVTETISSTDDDPTVEQTNNLAIFENAAGTGYVSGNLGIGGYTALGSNNYTEIDSFLEPYTFKPEEYRLTDNVYHMYQEVEVLQKHILTMTVRLSQPTLTGWAFSPSYPTLYATKAEAYADTGYAANGMEYVGGNAYRQKVIDGALNEAYLIPQGSFTREVSYSFSSSFETVEDCLLQYHAWIPPVWKAYNEDGDIVTLDPQPAATDQIWYCNLTERTKPVVGAGGWPILDLQNPAGPYAGGVRYNIDGTGAIDGYGGYGAKDGIPFGAGTGGYTGIDGSTAGTDESGGLSSLTIDATEYTYPATEEVLLTFPSGSYLLQSGSPSPAYPTFAGAFVYDLHQKRWGKQKGEYEKLVDYTPLNTDSSKLITYTQFGINAAALKADGIVYTFDANPTDSQIKYGKIGITRLGLTSLEEVNAQFRLYSTGTIEVETSLDGKAIDATLTKTQSFANVKHTQLLDGYVGKWHNIAFTGQFDLTYLEYRSYSQGRR